MAFITNSNYNFPSYNALAPCNAITHIYLYNKIYCIYCIPIGLKTTPTCLEYCPGSFSLLFIGDDKGCIAYMKFLQPKRSLFKRDPTNKIDIYLWKVSVVYLYTVVISILVVNK